MNKIWTGSETNLNKSEQNRIWNHSLQNSNMNISCVEYEKNPKRVWTKYENSMNSIWKKSEREYSKQSDNSTRNNLKTSYSTQPAQTSETIWNEYSKQSDKSIRDRLNIVLETVWQAYSKQSWPRFCETFDIPRVGKLNISVTLCFTSLDSLPVYFCRLCHFWGQFNVF